MLYIWLVSIEALMNENAWIDEFDAVVVAQKVNKELVLWELLK